MKRSRLCGGRKVAVPVRIFMVALQGDILALNVQSF